MSPTLALLPSPLLGPAVWAGVAGILAERGWAVAVPPAFSSIGSFRDVVAHWEQALPDRGDYVLVPHSNAGLYVPAIGERRRVVGTVFTDAALPPPSGTTPMAPPAMYRMLAGLADADGLLPPWTQWWSTADLEAVLPDAAARAAVTSEQVRLPLAYFSDRMPVAAGWTDSPAAYLAFGDTYRRERRAATDRGWPARTLEGNHLLMLTDPALVASVLEELLEALGIEG